jgi:hypothetical protein
MNRILFLAALLFAGEASAAALTTWQAWVTANPFTARQVAPQALVVKGIGTETYYMLEVDPTTGKLPVEAAVTLEGASFEVANVGATGTAVPADAGYIGGTDGTNLRGVKVDTSGELQVDVLSSALPSGAATAANQATGNTTLASIDAFLDSLDGKTPDYTTGDGLVDGGTIRVTLASDQSPVSVAQSGTWDIGSITGGITLPTGAATEATLAGVESIAGDIDAKLVQQSLGTGTAAGAVRVVTASDSPSPKGRAFADSKRNAYATTSVTTGAWVELIAATAAVINALQIFDSCGEVLELGVGAAASESRVLLIPPGGFDAAVPLHIPAGSRVAIKAVSANCTAGQLVLTGLN